jgi:hypothetical protein
MADDPADPNRDAARPLAPGDTNASRHPHDDGRGTPAQPENANRGQGDASGRDVPPADDRRKKRNPDSPWMGGG